MSTELATKQDRPIDMLKSVINAPSVQSQFGNALGEHKDAFVASLIDLFTGDKSLQACQPASIVAEALRAATLRLPLNKALGFSYIIVFNNNVKNPDGTWTKVPTPTFIPGYKGYIQLAMRTGQYKTINADFVYEGELRKVNKLTGEIAFDGEKKSDKIVGYFCYFELLNGFSKTLYVSVEDIANYALRYSPSFKGKNKPQVEDLIKAAQTNQTSTKVGWEGNFNDMGLKTVVRRLLSKYGYLSVEMQDAISKDNTDTPQQQIITVQAEERKPIMLDETQYEKVDTETGEIKTEAPATEEEQPQY